MHTNGGGATEDTEDTENILDVPFSLSPLFLSFRYVDSVKAPV
jgi:hypothetical protein